ncbi:GtrA family protein [Rhizobium sp. BK512]|uniref:GtrA family protein n=1 Tax=Rhizobium sp. BK512 TaxID=2587010 RepID=UPI00391BCC54
MALLAAVLATGTEFAWAQASASVVTVIVNFSGNNLMTCRDQRLRGRGLLRGLSIYSAVVSPGAAVNVGIATALFAAASPLVGRRSHVMTIDFLPCRRRRARWSFYRI